MGCTQPPSPRTQNRMRAFVALTIVSAVVNVAESENAAARARARRPVSPPYDRPSLEPRITAPAPYGFPPETARALVSALSRCRSGTEVELGPGHAEVRVGSDGGVISVQAWSRGEGTYRRTTLACIEEVLATVRFPPEETAVRTLDISWFLPSW